MTSMFATMKNHQLRKATEAMHAVAASAENCYAFTQASLAVLPDLVPSDITTLSLCDLKTGERTVFGRQAEELSSADRATFNRFFRQHPLVQFHGSHPRGPTQRISDCLSPHAFRQTGLFSDYYRRIGVNYAMALPLRVDSDTLISIVFNRSGPDFTDADRAVLEVVRPQLAALYRSLVAQEEAQKSLEKVTGVAAGDGWEVALIALDGRIMEAGAATLRLFRRYFPDDCKNYSTRLPTALISWLARSRQLERHQPTRSNAAFLLTRFGARLTVHLIPHPSNGQQGYLLIREQRHAIAEDDLAFLPLTKREREVLALVAAGKTNLDIATILAISARTVQKHLEHIFVKLGVESRMAAAVHAWEAVAAGPIPGS